MSAGKEIGPRFFSHIKSYFKEKYSGRYLSILLAELVRLDPRAMLSIVQHSKLDLSKEFCSALRSGLVEVVLEWRFPETGRRADLVFCLDHVPILIVEIKDEDGRKSNAEQLRDYVAFLRSNPVELGWCSFLFLSRYMPHDDDARELLRAEELGLPVASMLHGKLHTLLGGARSEVGRMLREYLEDTGVTYREIDLKRERPALTYLTTKMLGISYLKGHGRTVSAPTIAALPELMNLLFGNAGVLGDWIHQNNRKSFNQRFHRHFGVTHEHSLPRRSIAKVLKAQNAADVQKTVFEMTEIDGGTVWFFSEGSFRGLRGGWARVVVGYWFDIGAEEKMAFGQYASFSWPGSEQLGKNEEAYKDRKMVRFPSEMQAQKNLRICMEEAKKRALAVAPPRYKKIFSTFRIP